MQFSLAVALVTGVLAEVVKLRGAEEKKSLVEAKTQWWQQQMINNEAMSIVGALTGEVWEQEGAGQPQGPATGMNNWKGSLAEDGVPVWLGGQAQQRNRQLAIALALNIAGQSGPPGGNVQTPAWGQSLAEAECNPAECDGAAPPPCCETVEFSKKLLEKDVVVLASTAQKLGHTVSQSLSETNSPSDIIKTLSNLAEVKGDEKFLAFLGEFAKIITADEHRLKKYKIKASSLTQTKSAVLAATKSTVNTPVPLAIGNMAEVADFFFQKFWRRSIFGKPTNF